MSDDENPIGGDSGFDNAGGTYNEDDNNLADGADQGGASDGLDVTGDYQNQDDSAEPDMEVLHADGTGTHHGFSKNGAPQERITTQYLTKYERARVLGTR
eukprot:887067_1